MEITIGCDPEFYVFDRALSRIIPACGLVPGTKDEPHALSKGTVQLDGTLIEIGIDPAKTADEFVDNIRTTVQEVQAMLDEQSPDRYLMLCGAMAGYDERDEFPEEALVVGCSAQYHLYDNGDYVYLNRVPTQSDKLDKSAIPAGGHVHIGLDCNEDITSEVLLRTLYRLRNYLTWMSTESLPSANQRITRMGSRQIIRPKPYGMEERTLSSYWLYSEDSIRSIFECTYNSVLSCKNQVFNEQPRTDMSRMLRTLEGAVYEAPSHYQTCLPVAFQEV